MPRGIGVGDEEVVAARGVLQGEGGLAPLGPQLLPTEDYSIK